MTVLMICLVLASITELFKSRKLFCLCCSFQLLIGFIGLAVTLWIYWTGINNDVKDFMFGLIVSSYFMVRELSGGCNFLLGCVCKFWLLGGYPPLHTCD